MGASRSVMLAPSSSSPPARKFALAPNRVLPAPPYARLRPTHNGSALLTAGTIRGSKRQQGRFLQQHRLFHSDPDIARGRGNARNDERERGDDGKGRVGGGVASDRKCRKKKKSRAPQPPPSGHPDACRCIVVTKTKAPLPPTPPTEETTTRTASSWESSRQSTGGYEKKVPPLEKWRHCRSVGDVRADEAGGPAFDSTFQQEIRAATQQRALQQEPPKFYFGVSEADCRSPLRGLPPACSPTEESDMRLRPMLPRRPLQLPKFSTPWRCSSSDSEDEGRPMPCDWTPRQDLSDDGSDEEETRPSETASEIRFPLPAVMFSNRRPLGDTKGRGLGEEDSHWASSRREGRGVVAKGVSSDSNWTFGLQNRGRHYSSELLLSSKKRNELIDDRFGEFLLGDVLASKAGQIKKSNFSFGQTKKSSDSGHSNFSFYSTDGRVAYSPTEPPKGRVSEIRRRFDANLSAKGRDKQEEAGRRRDLQLARMLEDEVRRRRNREKAGLREELRRLKRRMDEDDEAYFTEPFGEDSIGTRLGHWQSEPALIHQTAPVGVSLPWSSSSSPSPVPPPPPRRRGDEGRGRGKEERGRGDSVYKRLMDIVRREERNLDAQRASSTTPTSSSDSSTGERGNAHQEGAKAFLQPYSHYRPIHFSLHQAGQQRNEGLQIS